MDAITRELCLERAFSVFSQNLTLLVKWEYLLAILDEELVLKKDLEVSLSKVQVARQAMLDYNQ